MIAVKRFSGILNTDDREADVLPNQHVWGRNIRFIGGANGLTGQNIKGAVVVSNSNLPPGTNEVIGAFFDPVRQRIIWFNWNQYGNNGIYSYSVQTETITQIFRCGVNSATDILGFNLNYPIVSAGIVYRTTSDGDLLYWTDGTNRPMYLNLDTVASLSPFTSDMINAAKNAPGTPIAAAYGDDATITTNSLRKKLFRFCYRWIYKNLDRSTFSPISEVPLPVGVNNPTIDNDPTKNNKITLTIYTGGSDFQSVELAVQESLGDTWSDFKSVAIFDRDDYNLTSNSSFTFDFYNNGGYNLIDPTETDLYFDWLPNKANALEILNGNVIIYGGITDGANGLQREDVDVQITASDESISGAYGAAYKWGGLYRYGLQYFDDRNKPIGGVVSFVADAVDTTDFSVSMPDYIPTTQPQITASINHTPPVGATKYQWVRTKEQTTSKFLFWLTNDFQSDSSFLYFCIQNLIDQQAENTGYVPSYEFTQGDRLRIYGNFDITGNIQPFNNYLDFEILGTVTRTMTNPASEGLFVKVARPTTMPTPGIALKVLVEIYTPASNVDEKSLVFYEFGEKYDIYESGGNRYHRGGSQDQTAVQPALFLWRDGDVYFRTRDFGKITIFPINLATLIMDANFSDFFTSAVNSNGRAWLIDENIREEYNPVLVRWGGKYQPGTNLNALNRFRPNDFDEVDRSKGDIRRFKVRDRILRVFQDRGCGQYGVYARFIQNNEGQAELVTTNEIITTNNIQYYQGVFGLGGYATNLCSSPIADYFTDIVTGRGIRLGYDGLTDLGMLYKGQFYFPALVTPYNKTLLRSNGYTAKVMAFYDSLDGDFHTILQAGSADGTTTSGSHFAFNEPRNGYVCAQYDYQPDFAMSANDVIYSWNGGYLYKHTSENPYTFFYGIQYPAEIGVVFNDNLLEKKSWHALSEVANAVWACPEIYSNVNTYPGQRQETNLIAVEFTTLEGMPSSAIKRDAYSPGGKVNGQFMKGNWLRVKFRVENASNFVFLNEVTATFSDSPKTDS